MGNDIFDFLIGLKRDNNGEKGKKEKIEIVGEKGKWKKKKEKNKIRTREKGKIKKIM